jgi:hypothetical protein
MTSTLRTNMLRTRTRTNPLFAPEAFALLVGPERAQRALTDPDSVDLLVWNVFSTLDSHDDPRWMAGRWQQLGGPGVREPVRLSLWTGRDREPLLHPPSSYITQVRERARAAGGDDASVAEFAAPVEIPVRLESPDVLALIDAVGDQPGRGRGGRDRLTEVIDVAIEQARRLGKTAAVGVIYRAGSAAAAELSPRINALRNDRVLAAELSHRPSLPPVVLREISWQQLLRIWQSELGYLAVDGLPVKPFLAHCRERGLL